MEPALKCSSKIHGGLLHFHSVAVMFILMSVFSCVLAVGPAHPADGHCEAVPEEAL